MYIQMYSHCSKVVALIAVGCSIVGLRIIVKISCYANISLKYKVFQINWIV